MNTAFKKGMVIMKNELKTLMQRLPEGVDGAIIGSDTNRRYFTGMKSSAGTLVLTRNAARFIIDFRYIEKAKSVVTGIDVELQDKLHEQILAFFREQDAKNIAVEADSVTVSAYAAYQNKLPGLTILGDDRLSALIRELRSIKSPEEVSFIEQAQAITDKTFSHILSFIRPGVTEREIAIEMEYTMLKLGASGLAFETIVASGVNSSMPHAVPSDKKVEKGDFVTMDFGAAYNGYCSDMTRTVAVGAVSDEQKKVYDTVLTAQLMAIEAIPKCRHYQEVDKVARDYIYAQGYEGCFGHGLGHSLGLNIHEEPRFGSSCDKEIQENVIQTVEPGVYLEGRFGVRIEDMVLIGKGSVRDLTHSEKKLIIL